MFEEKYRSEEGGKKEKPEPVRVAGWEGWTEKLSVFSTETTYPNDTVWPGTENGCD